MNEGSSDTVHSTVSYALPDNVEDLYLDDTAATGTGNSGSNKIFGNGVNNTLDDGDAVGSTITNTLSGGKGGDTYIIHSSATMVTGETNIGGVDSVRSFVNFILPKNVEDLTLMGTLDTSGKGNNLSNTIIGNSGNNTLDGGAGADTLEGGTGDDLYIIDRATDVIHESTTSGTDTIQSIVTYALPTNVENLTLVGLATISGTGNADANIIVGNGAANTLNGGAGNDVLRGEKGNDVLIGDGGNDTLIGGVGVDTLTGGDGADTFMFESLTEMGTATRRDVITDFQTSVDKIDLLRLTSETLTSKGTSAFDATNQIRWSFYGAGTTASPYYAVVQGNLSGDLLPEFEIKLAGVTSLTDSDFMGVVIPQNVSDIILDEYNGHTYLLSTSTTWEGAEAQAIAMGGHLVTINDAAENTWLANTFTTAQHWIGLTDKVTEGTFAWANGEAVTYTNWDAPIEPNDYKDPSNYYSGQDYGITNCNSLGFWDDESNNPNLTDSLGVRQGIIELNATNSTLDNIAPVFSKATVSGKTLTLSYVDAHSLSNENIPTTAFSVLSGGVANSVTSVRVDALAKTVTLNLANDITSGSISYTDLTTGNDNNVIQDSAGNDALSLQITHQTMSGVLTTTDNRIESGAGAYFDSYPITGVTNGATMSIALNSSSFDTYIQVIRDGVGVVAIANEGGDGTNALLNYTYQTGDTIYATAGYNYNGSLPPTGAYTLTIIAI